MSEIGPARRNVVIVLGIVCIVLAVGLVGVSAFFMSIIGDENNKISELSSQISELEGNVTNLQNQLSWVLTPTISLERIVSDPSEFVNKTVVVEGKLSGPCVYFTSISWGYELSTNGTVMPQTDLGPNTIGVDLGFRGRVYSAEDVVVTGIVKKGYIGTIHSGESPTVSYYIEAEFVVPK